MVLILCSLTSAQYDNLDIAFILDGTVSRNDFDKVKEVAESLVSFLSSDIDAGKIQIGCVTSADDVDISFMIGDQSRSRDVQNAISRIRYPSGRNNVLYDALTTVKSDLFEATGRTASAKNLVVIISNGGDVSNSDQVIRYKEELEGEGYAFFSSYINRDDDYRLIRSLSSGNNYGTYDTIVDDENFGTFEGALAIADANTGGGSVG